PCGASGVTAIQAQATEPAADGSQTHAVFSIDLSNPSEYATTMTVSVAPGSSGNPIEEGDVQTITVSVDGTDYTLTWDSSAGAYTGDVTFAAGTTRAELTLVAADDATYEGVEGFTVSVSNAQTNGQALNDASADGSIADEDGDEPGDHEGDVPVLDVAAVVDTAVEGGQDASFTVTLSNPSEYETTMTISVAPGSTDPIEEGDVQTITVDVNGTDTILVWDSSLGAFTGDITMAAGQTEATLTLVAADDDLYEKLENFVVTASNAQTNGQAINSDSADGKIRSNDMPMLIAAAAIVSEEGLIDGIKDNVGNVDTTDSTEDSGNVGLANASVADFTFSLSAPTDTLTSDGTALSWSLSGDGHTLTGSANGADIVVVTIDDNGDYDVKLTGHLDHTDPTSEDNLSFNVGVAATDGSATANSTITVTVEDDSPVATAHQLTASVTTGDVNLMIVLDMSKSMDGDSGVAGYASTLDLAKAAINDLLTYYGENANNVKVSIVTFNSESEQQGTAWMDLLTAKAVIDGLTAAGGTDYDAAIATLESLVSDNSAGMISGANNILYFISDGVPNEDNNTGSNGIVGAEETAWQTFLSDNSITAYAIGLGSSATNEYLDTISYDGVTGTDTDAIIVTDLSQLSGVLKSLVEVETATGTTDGSSFGADGGHIQSIGYDGVTYTFDAGSNTVATSDGSDADYDTTSTTLSIDTEHGTLVVNLVSGSYSYTPDSEQDALQSQENFTYTLVDNDGDTSSSTLTVTINANQSELYVGDNDDNTKTSTLGSDVLIGDVAGVVVTPGEAPNYNVSLILDISGSMVGDRLANLKEAVNTLLSQLADFEGTINLQIVAFNGSATTVYSIDDFDSNELSDAQTAVNALTADGTTNYEAAFNAASDWFSTEASAGYDSGADYSNISFFLSDGEPRSYYDDSGKLQYSDSVGYTEGLEAYNNLVSNNQVTVSAIGLNIDPDSTFGQQLTNFDSDGNPDYVEDSADADALTAALQGALDDLTEVPLGNDTLVGTAGNDVIFGDTVNSDSLSWDGYAAGTHDGLGYTGLLEYLTQLNGGTAPTDAEIRNYIINNADALNDDTDTRGGNDILIGGEGDDLIFGQGGDDQITGGAGDDVMHGGQGQDTFIWLSGDQGSTGDPASDVVADFHIATSSSDSNADVLDLSDMLPDTSGQDLSNYLHFETDSSSGSTDTVLYVSTSGQFASGDHSQADQVITLKGVDLSSSGSSDTEIINNLLNNHQLVVDHS
ncbi:hypothetical protein WH50_18755, partial [Pokkaliibacter plantistimulans]